MQIRQELTEDGVRLEDQVLVHPLFGRKRSANLLFTEVIIQSVSNYDPPQFEGNHWFFPSISHENVTLTLKLDPELNRYLLESSDFFKINGLWTQMTFLKRGDCLQLFGNRIIFLGATKGEHHQRELPFVGRKLNVLVTGETGTGKTSLAKKIHSQSQLPGNFTHLNLAAYAQGLIESEIFGHVKGAFTGAINDKKGAIESAKGGTLFLDEIDSLSLEVQTKLLTYLDEGEFRRVGSPQAIRIKPRFIFASGRNLQRLVEEGKIRRDFYYRVASGIQISLKSLREDSERIEACLDNFEQKNAIRLNSKLREFYLRLPWYGNYRQLEGHLEKKLELSKSHSWDFDKTDEDLLVNPNQEVEETKRLKLDQLEYHYVEKTYQSLSGDEKSTCDVLSISKYRLRKILGMAS